MAILYPYNRIPVILCAGLFMLTGACKKLVAIDEPTNTLTTTKLFNTDAQAEGAMAGVYTRMINGDDPGFTSSAAINVYSAGLSTILGGLSSDELVRNDATLADRSFYAFNTNKLTIYNNGLGLSLWTGAYAAIYGANSVIEGIADSRSVSLRDSTRKALTGEAKFVRALTYFYLTNFFGDVPLALTIDFNKTAMMPRTPQAQVYTQIIHDLQDAKAALPAGYPVARNGRARPNKWAAAALLARVYLYQKKYAEAAQEATEVIGQAGLYVLEPSLNDVFLAGSREAIWQLQQTNTSGLLGNATPEGLIMIPGKPYTSTATFAISDQLLQAFEPGDKRRHDWVDSTDNSYFSNQAGAFTRYPVKYKTGGDRSVFGSPITEYYVVLRLAEMYLIRAEARALGADGGPAAAVADLNTIRHRSGLDDLLESLTATQVLQAVARERQIELFAEWGHRWFDLKRTGQAAAVLQTIALKQPWWGEYQLLYPIPAEEISKDPALTQNKDY